MNNRSTPPRSFNTVRNSNRDARQKRRQQGRAVLLAICSVAALILLTLTVFLVWSIVDVVSSNVGKNPNDTEPPIGGNTPPSGEASYVTATKESQAIHTGVLVVVNDRYEYQFPASNTGVLVNIYDNRPKVNGANVYQLSDSTIAKTWSLNVDALNAFNEMMKKYYEISEGDSSVTVTSAYRSAKDQEGYATAVGHSDHHTGYCVALQQTSGSGKTQLPQDHWIYRNASQYGFVVRYPADKEELTGVSDYTYCFRYVGVAHATYMYENNLCLEEYTELLKATYTADNHLKLKGADGKSYEVYYVPASKDELTSISCPKDYSYSISGDNIGGFIVTVDLSTPVA